MGAWAPTQTRHPFTRRIGKQSSGEAATPSSRISRGRSIPATCSNATIASAASEGHAHFRAGSKMARIAFRANRARFFVLVSTFFSVVLGSGAGHRPDIGACLVLSCLVLSCLVLPCLVLSCSGRVLTRYERSWRTHSDTSSVCPPAALVFGSLADAPPTECGACVAHSRGHFFMSTCCLYSHATLN